LIPKDNCVPSRQGFTLLEVLLVMAILVIMLAVAMPTLEGMMGNTRTRGAADEVTRAWATARSRSIDNGVPYRFAVQPESSKYRVAPDRDEYWSGDSGNDTDDGTVLAGALPEGIRFQLDANQPAMSNGSDSNWTPVVIFLPDGTSRADARIVVHPGDDGSPLYISVRALTGIVTVRTPKQMGIRP